MATLTWAQLGFGFDLKNPPNGLLIHFWIQKYLDLDFSQKTPLLFILVWTAMETFLTALTIRHCRIEKETGVS